MLSSRASSPITAARDLVERHAAAQEVLAVEAAQHDVGVGHRGAVAAAAVGRRSRHRAGRARPDLEGAGLVDEGDRAAAGADRVHVDHRHQHREAAIQVSRAVASPKPPCVTMPISAEVPPTSKVMRLRLPGQAARPVAADHAGRRAREQGEHGPLGHHAGVGDAAVRTP
jgi:hypothetical protein